MSEVNCVLTEDQVKLIHEAIMYYLGHTYMGPDKGNRFSNILRETQHIVDAYNLRQSTLCDR